MFGAKLRHAVIADARKMAPNVWRAHILQGRIGQRNHMLVARAGTVHKPEANIEIVQRLYVAHARADVSKFRRSLGQFLKEATGHNMRIDVDHFVPRNFSRSQYRLCSASQKALRLSASPTRRRKPPYAR